jgi:hypothetical protein
MAASGTRSRASENGGSAKKNTHAILRRCFSRSISSVLADYLTDMVELRVMIASKRSPTADY